MSIFKARANKPQQIRWPPPNSEAKADPTPPEIQDIPQQPPPRAYGWDAIEGEREDHLHSRLLPATVLLSTQPVGVDFLQSPNIGFEIRSLIVTNLTAHTLFFPEILGFVPPQQSGFILSCRPATKSIRAQVLTQGATGGTVYIIADQIERDPTTAAMSASSGGGCGVISGNVGLVGALHHTGSVITLAAGAGALAARATRNGGFLHARLTNVGNITVDGTVLHPGDVLNFTASDAYALTGTTGDIVDVYEEYN
jgi:hypothetical protein